MTIAVPAWVLYLALTIPALIFYAALLAFAFGKLDAWVTRSWVKRLEEFDAENLRVSDLRDQQGDEGLEPGEDDLEHSP